MLSTQSNSFLDVAIAYAARRWLLTDEVLIAELHQLSPPTAAETPEEWIDAFAEKYDLYDPRDFGLEDCL